MTNEMALLKDWLERKGMKRDCRSVAREQILEFLRVSINTLNRWLRGSCPPFGQNLVRIRYFLHKIGISGIEIPVDPEVMKLMEAVSLRFITTEKVMKAIELPDESSAVGYMLKRARPNKKRCAQIQELLKKFETEKWLKKYAIFKSLEATKSPESIGPRVYHTVDRKEILLALAKQIWATKSLAEVVLSPAFTPSDRQEFRSICGKDLGETHEKLECLISEVARSRKIQG